MVIDTSALVAILGNEPEKDTFIEAIANDPDPIISAATLLETRIVIEARSGAEGTKRLDQLLETGGVRTAAFDATQSEAAYRAWKEFGRGNSPAGLNLGDCFSYALAKQSGRPLLFKGDDFAKTDLVSAT